MNGYWPSYWTADGSAYDDPYRGPHRFTKAQQEAFIRMDAANKARKKREARERAKNKCVVHGTYYVTEEITVQLILAFGMWEPMNAGDAIRWIDKDGRSVASQWLNRTGLNKYMRVTLYHSNFTHGLLAALKASRMNLQCEYDRAPPSEWYPGYNNAPGESSSGATKRGIMKEKNELSVSGRFADVRETKYRPGRVITLKERVVDPESGDVVWTCESAWVSEPDNKPRTVKIAEKRLQNKSAYAKL
jgi:hypothetical protein